jgi:hypothetical protein
MMLVFPQTAVHPPKWLGQGLIATQRPTAPARARDQEQAIFETLPTHLSLLIERLSGAVAGQAVDWFTANESRLIPERQRPDQTNSWRSAGMNGNTVQGR